MSKIIYFSSSYSPHDFRFLSALSTTTHTVYYVRLGHGSDQIESRPVPAAIEQVQWTGNKRPLTGPGLALLTCNLRDVVRKIKPDLIHAGPIQTCAFLAALSGFRPLLTMSWGFDLMQDVKRNTWSRWTTRYTLRHSTFFTSDAEITRKKAIEYGMDPGRTVVFPWGVDLEQFTPPAFTRSQEKDFTLICNRSWEARYGVDVLARAFVKVAKLNKNISLLLLGEGSQKAVIHEIFEQGGSTERVTFAGQISQTDLPRYYHMADLYISSSHIDGSSVSLLEALACGLPCLVSDIPANKEWVEENVNGWLFPDGNDEALAQFILSIYEKREDLSVIRQNARKTAEKKADWKKSVSILLETYERLAGLNA